VSAPERETPLVVAVVAIPLIGEGVASALDGLAECKVVPARRPELTGLLKSLQPDAIVVDDEEEAEAAAAYARFARVPVIRIALRERRVQLLADRVWVQPDDADATPETIRNLVAAEIYGRRVPH
jgi:hypothetical protein